MLSYTTADLQNNTTHLQNLAQTSPILITDGDKKQVLMDYDEYKKLAKVDDEKSFVSLYDAFFANMSPELYQLLAEMDDEDLEDEPVDDEKPFVSAYDVLLANVPKDLANALAQLDDDELE